MKNITVEELKDRINRGEKINLIDCREPHEYEDFNLGGKLIPLGRFHSFQVDELEDLKDEEVIVYCKSGNRSGQACLILDTLGFSDTKNLTGGISEWERKFGRS
jgi:rhodanese-related sulfurtransferase